ncbi:MAG: BatA domain-containing protein [Verrucomicrobiales bacterium]|nr:BatA domain-containing protein [Verrucomicrobiales bacterium]
MSFLQPILLIGLPLALLPIIIHLINQHRHRTVQWAAMMFLLDAKKLTKGIARLRQILILSLRVLAVLLLFFAASRPLAGGWLALTGGKPDTVLILLDRSASMEQQILETGESKRSAVVTKLADLLEKTAGGSNLVLIDSATLEPTPITDAAALSKLPQVAATATSANVPNLLQRAVDYLETDESGRTDIWLASDLRQSDWETGSGKWQTLRSDLSTRETVRLLLLNYSETESENFSISVSNVKRLRSPEGIQLVMDLRIRRQSANEGEVELPVEFTINGTRTIQEMTITGPELVRLGHTISLGQNNLNGWGRLDLPADGNLADNTAFLVFDDEAIRKTVIVSDDAITAQALVAAAKAPVEAGVTYETEIVTLDQLTRIPWDETALLFWHAPIPAKDSPISALLRQHVESGRTLVFLPPPDADSESLFGFQWKEWNETANEPFPIEWWRTGSGLLANTQSGEPLPVGDLSFFRTRDFGGEFQPLLRSESSAIFIAKITSETSGSVYAWGTLPRTDHSSLATEGVVFFVMIHRALEEGANAVATAQFRETGSEALVASGDAYTLIDSAGDSVMLSEEGLLPSAVKVEKPSGKDYFIAINRPPSEDDTRLVAPEALVSLFEGIDFRQVSDELDSGSSLASEVWRFFLIAMALALLAEAILSLPPRIEEPDVVHGFPKTQKSQDS